MRTRQSIRELAGLTLSIGVFLGAARAGFGFDGGIVQSLFLSVAAATLGLSLGVAIVLFSPRSEP
jgi:hypothetical protein